MSFEDLEPRSGLLDTVQAVTRESLDSYSVADLQARIVALEGEIVRVKAAIESKSSQRSAADALFKF